MSAKDKDALRQAIALLQGLLDRAEPVEESEEGKDITKDIDKAIAEPDITEMVGAALDKLFGGAK